MGWEVKRKEAGLQPEEHRDAGRHLKTVLGHGRFDTTADTTQRVTLSNGGQQ
jgi:hypothetical protein